MDAGSFTVREAERKDVVGRAFIRLDRGDMDALSLKTGDLVRVEGGQYTGLRVLPGIPSSRKPGTVQMDGIGRENAGAGIGETVRLQKIEGQLEARFLTLGPIGRSLLAQKDAEAVSRLIENLPMCKGDRVRVSPFGNLHQEFRVIKLVPDGPCLVGTTTRVELDIGPQAQGPLRQTEQKERSVTYEDIGGLRKEIQRIREVVELPLTHPEVFERLGIDPPKGVLLYGPPGCGKTLIAKAVANEVRANFFSITGPEIFIKWVGESAQRLRQLFEEARRSPPAIIFIDEIDALAPKRADMGEGGAAAEQHKNVVAQLLACMDGLDGRGQVVVIGATNIPDNLDPALRRPGRFDREIDIGVPDRDGRLEILEIHTRAMPFAEDVDLTGIARETHGFSGADLAALVREAAFDVIRGIPGLNLHHGIIPELKEVVVRPSNFDEARKLIHPSALREVFLEKPDVRWEDVGGLEAVKRGLEEVVQWPLKHPELFRRMATPPPKGILIVGPPGCGKTLIAKAVANETEVNFIPAKGPELLSKWMGETERHIREMFRKARQAAPCIIFFDEIDAIAARRGRDASGSSDRALSQLLNEIDGIEELKGVVLIGATNRIDLLDEAILRPGRFDLHFELPLPDEEARRKIFEVHTRRKPLAKDVDLYELAADTEGLSGADIMGICTRASLMAMREFLDSGEKDLARCVITAAHLEKASRPVVSEGKNVT